MRRPDRPLVSSSPGLDSTGAQIHLAWIGHPPLKRPRSSGSQNTGKWCIPAESSLCFSKTAELVIELVSGASASTHLSIRGGVLRCLSPVTGHLLRNTVSEAYGVAWSCSVPRVVGPSEKRCEVSTSDKTNLSAHLSRRETSIVDIPTILSNVGPPS